MAQPVFDGHPLEQYFQDSGEVSEPMPGGLADLLLQPYLIAHPSVSKHALWMEKLCFLLFGAVQSLSSFFSSDRVSLRTQAFAERFKYGVISSSLLSPAFPTTPIVESHRHPASFPGKLHNGHSRTSSAAESLLTDCPSLSMPPEPDTPLWPVTLSFTIAIAAFSARFYFLALLLLVGTLYYIRVHRVDMSSKPDVMTPSLLALQHLISAGQLWDTLINDTFTILENEERSIFHGSTTPLTPSSSLRVALSSSLLTTQTQCDNVRQLLSAITSPSELAQLAEMYAPPSPVKSTFARSNDACRPSSHPCPPPRGTPMTDRARKRSTWNGSYSSLAANSPSFQRSQRREKRRSDLSALTGSPCPPRGRSQSIHSSPPQPLTDVSEEEDGMVTADEMENSFGAAALELCRNRVSGGLRAFELSHRKPLSPTRGTTMSPGSRYTSMHTTKHLFSLSSLRQSLSNALASKRFACSHLLALRFEDHEDDVYWEDVRSVMGLLTSTLIDASSRLSEVLDQVEEHRLEDDDDDDSEPTLHRALSQSIAQIVSFAPTPSHLSRFATHIGAISSALDDAREQLERCVVALKEPHSPGHSSHPSTSSTDEPTRFSDEQHPAIRAYERLRRELGIALRECERGRERLVHIVTPPTPSTTDEEAVTSCKPMAADAPVPAASDADADVELECPVDDDRPTSLTPIIKIEAEEVEDDATTPLLLSTSAAHLPPPGGAEHVFEADAVPSTFTRARSGLSREERIRQAKLARSTTAANANPNTNASQWGPTEEVVSELKDVIWKVGQRRRPNVAS